MKDIFSTFSECCLRRGDHVVAYFPQDDSYEAKTYRELLQESTVLSRYLNRFQLPSGTCVGLLSENRYEWLVAYFAAVAHGFTVVPLDPKLSLSDWIKFLQFTNAPLLFTSNSCSNSLKKEPRLLEIFKEIIVWGSPPPPAEGWKNYSEIIKDDWAVWDEPRKVGDHSQMTASLLFTSGTTGKPKGICLSHQNLLYSSQQISRSPDRKNKICANLLPLHHIYGFTVALANILKGQSLVLYPKFDLKMILKSFQVLKPHAIAGIPIFYERLGRAIQEQLAEEIPEGVRNFLKDPAYRFFGNQAADLQRVKKWIFKKVHALLGGRAAYLTSGGAPLEGRVGRFFNLMGIPILEGYGLSETGGLIAANDVGRKHYRLGSVGKVIKQSNLKIHNPDALGIGEVCVKGPGVMQGYFKDDSATKEALDSEGFFHTGDLGRIDHDGFLFLSGRKKDLIVTSNGKKVFPEELEFIFSSLPGILEVCVFGISRTLNGKTERIHLQIVPDTDYGKREGVTDLEAFLKKSIQEKAQTLPEFKRPQSLGFSKEPFPRTTTQKVRKFLVKQAFLNQGAAALHSPSLETDEKDLLMNTKEGKAVRELLEKVLSEKPILSSSSSLSLDLSLDSLSLMEFWSSIEERFGIIIPEEKVLELADFGAVVEYVLKNPGSKAPTVSEKQTVKSWEKILEHISPEIEKRAHETLKALPGARKVFLKLFRAFFKITNRLTLQGLHRLPENGPYILAPNHECYLDNIFAACLLPRKVQENMAVIGAKEFLDKPLTRIPARLCRMLPIDRNKVSSAVLQTGAQVLKEGKILLIHPEGTRSPDGKLLPLKNGAGILACHFSCPIVPVHIEGGHEFWPKFSRFPKRLSPITVALGEPLFPLSSQRGENSTALLRNAEEITERLFLSLQALKEGRNNSPFTHGYERKQPAISLATPYNHGAEEQKWDQEKLTSEAKDHDYENRRHF